MTPRSIRRSVNPNPETAPKAAHLNGNRAQRIPFWPGGFSSDKSRIHSRRPNLPFSFFTCNKAADHTFRVADDPEVKRQIPFLDNHPVWANPCPLAAMGRHQDCAQATSLAARIPD